jgi:hypothetical protein
MTMRRKDLAALGCSDPDCGHDHRIIYFHGSCHLGAGTWVSYDKETGRLTIECAECETPIAHIDVLP